MTGVIPVHFGTIFTKRRWSAEAPCAGRPCDMRILHMRPEPPVGSLRRKKSWKATGLLPCVIFSEFRARCAVSCAPMAPSKPRTVRSRRVPPMLSAATAAGGSVA